MKVFTSPQDLLSGKKIGLTVGDTRNAEYVVFDHLFQIVSSFKTPNQATSIECHRIRSYAGHRDGVWEVSCARHTPTMIGTASAGKLHY